MRALDERAMTVTVLRLGHRPQRDQRVTTHVCLTARAFGADRIVVAEEDHGLEDNIRSVTDRFGGDFRIETGVPYRPLLRAFQGPKLHLTMYGLPHDEVAAKLDATTQDILIVVGAEKVPRDVYDLVDYNVSVGNQPHSEIAALAMVLHELRPDALKRRFDDAPMRILPDARGKKVEGPEAKDSNTPS